LKNSCHLGFSLREAVSEERFKHVVFDVLLIGENRSATAFFVILMREAYTLVLRQGGSKGGITKISNFPKTILSASFGRHGLKRF